MLYFLLSMLTGALIALMVAVNGVLTGQYGVYLATVVIHVVGLVLISALCATRRIKLFPKKRISPLYYLGGVIGVFTTVFNNLAFGKISLSALVALGLLGQAVSSLVIDQFGLLGMAKRKLRLTDQAGLLCMLLGTGYMLVGSPFAALPVIVSLLAGVSVVLGRTVNAALSAHTSELASTWHNYAVGLVFAAIALLALGRAELSAPLAISPQLWIYTGGLMGVCVVMLLNITVARVSAFYLTLLLFIGQVFTGIAVDVFTTRAFSYQNLVGGVLTTIGMALNLWLDRQGRGERL